MFQRLLDCGIWAGIHLAARWRQSQWCVIRQTKIRYLGYHLGSERVHLQLNKIRPLFVASVAGSLATLQHRVLGRNWKVLDNVLRKIGSTARTLQLTWQAIIRGTGHPPITFWIWWLLMHFEVVILIEVKSQNITKKLKVFTSGKNYTGMRLLFIYRDKMTIVTHRKDMRDMKWNERHRDVKVCILI